MIIFSVFIAKTSKNNPEALEQLPKPLWIQILKKPINCRVPSFSHFPWLCQHKNHVNSPSPNLIIRRFEG